MKETREEEQAGQSDEKKERKNTIKEFKKTCTNKRKEIAEKRQTGFFRLGVASGREEHKMTLNQLYFA